MAMRSGLPISPPTYPRHALQAAVDLGAILSQQGDPTGAEAAYRRALYSGHPDYAPTARNLLRHPDR